MNIVLDKVKRLPSDAGVYMMKDAAGRIIYVGKAKNISKRLKQYLDISKLELTEMAYELTENPWCSQSDALFYGAVYNDDYTCDGIDKKHSKIIKIQNLLLIKEKKLNKEKKQEKEKKQNFNKQNACKN